MRINVSNHRGFWTLFKRESLRFLRLANQTMLPSVVTTVLYIVVFGYFLGPKVSYIDGFPYIKYIFPGLLMMGITMASYQNSSNSLFISRYEKFIDDLLVAPISYLQMVSAYVLAAMLRGLIIAIIGLIVCLPIAKVPFHHPFLFLLSILASSLVFASLGVISGLWAERWDNIAIMQNYLITPLVFLGGVFYSAQTLPEHLRWILSVNPLFYMISAVRYSFLDQADLPFGLAFGVTLGLGFFFLGIAVHLFRRGYKLRE